jgi:hypothetical protein
VVVDGETGSLLKNLQDMLGLEHSMQGAAKENERVVSILKNWTRSIRDKRMIEGSRKRWVLEKMIEDISNNDEEVRGQGVALAEAVMVVDRTPRDVIGENGGFAGIKEIQHPITPIIRKTSAVKNSNKAIPIGENGGFAGIKEIRHPITPIIRKTSAVKNSNKAIPINTIKGFMEVQFEN